MTTITVDFPETVFSALHLVPDDFMKEMRITAAVKWYEQTRVSQDKAAEIAGLTRAEFINELSKAKVSPFQMSDETLKEDMLNAD
ncbi:MAG: UPF0175 family protein [Pseudomonadota bacterium]